MNIARFRRWPPQHRRVAAAARRSYRPLLERLENRELLAFDLTISPAATAAVSSSTASGTTTFTATATKANLSLSDIDTELQAGRDVVLDSGSTGAEAGNISTSGFTTHVF